MLVYKDCSIIPQIILHLRVFTLFKLLAQSNNKH